MMLTVRCPACRETSVTHAEVEVFARTATDGGAKRVVVDSMDELVAIDADMSKKPGRRENPAVRIWLWCDVCNGDLVLEVTYHRGETCLYVRLADAEEDVLVHPRKAEIRAVKLEQRAITKASARRRAERERDGADKG